MGMVNSLFICVIFVQIQIFYSTSIWPAKGNSKRNKNLKVTFDRLMGTKHKFKHCFLIQIWLQCQIFVLKGKVYQSIEFQSCKIHCTWTHREEETRGKEAEPFPPLGLCPKSSPRKAFPSCSHSGYYLENLGNWQTPKIEYKAWKWKFGSILVKLNMSHFAYACKMRCPLKLVLENSEYLWFYWTFCIVILDYGLKLHKLSNHTLVILQKWLEIH